MPSGPAVAGFGTESGGSPSGGGGGSSPGSFAPGPCFDCNSHTPPPPPPPPCDLETATVTLCGREVKYDKFCASGPPPITPAMVSEQASHPELQGEEVVFGCISKSQGESCQAHDNSPGGPHVDAVLSNFEQSKETEAAQKQFHQLVTDSPWLDTRDDAASGSQLGYARELGSNHLLFKGDEHELFHENGEGIDLVQAKLADRERAGQLALADVLTELEAKFTAQQDMPSAKSTALYLRLARSRAGLLEAISCDLREKAAVNRVRQNNMTSLTADTVTGGASGGASSVTGGGGASDVSGAGGNPLGHKAELATANDAGGTSTSTGTALASVSGTSTATGTAASLATATDRDADILFSFGGIQMKETPPPPDEFVDDLFTRVHRKYQELEGRNRFYRTLLD